MYSGLSDYFFRALNLPSKDQSHAIHGELVI
jgi:hypothetical protein